MKKELIPEAEKLVESVEAICLSSKSHRVIIQQKEDASCGDVDELELRVHNLCTSRRSELFYYCRGLSVSRKHFIYTIANLMEKDCVGYVIPTETKVLTRLLSSSPKQQRIRLAR